MVLESRIAATSGPGKVKGVAAARLGILSDQIPGADAPGFTPSSLRDL
jgi:hypothetical protein